MILSRLVPPPCCSLSCPACLRHTSTKCHPPQHTVQHTRSLTPGGSWCVTQSTGCASRGGCGPKTLSRWWVCGYGKWLIRIAHIARSTLHSTLHDMRPLHYNKRCDVATTQSAPRRRPCKLLLLLLLLYNTHQALDLFQRVGEVAEQEKHHPDLHLEVGVLACCPGACCRVVVLELQAQPCSSASSTAPSPHVPTLL